MIQPIAAQDPGTDSRPAATAGRWAAPWAILGVWLAFDLAIVIYWASREWGFLRALPLLFALALHLLGLTGWLTAFAVLADCHWRLRAAYFAAGTAAVAAFGFYLFGFGDIRTAGAYAAWQTGLAIPFVIVHRLGWRITAAGLSARDRLQVRWQFNIGDLLLTTALIAMFLGLLLGNGGLHTVDEIYLLPVLLLAPPAIIVASLAWRKLWLAALASAIGCTVLALVPMAWHDSTRPAEIPLLTIIVNVPVASLLAASGWLRQMGYRLR